MDTHLRRLLRIPPLTAANEHLLAVRVREGDAAARAELIEASLRLVALHVCRLRVRPNDLDDAIQAASLALIRAVDAFDPGRGVRLATYAWPWIQAAVVGATSAERIPTVGADLHKTGADLPTMGLDDFVAEVPIDCRVVLASRLGRDSPDGSGRTRSEVAEHLGLTISQVRTREAKAVAHLRSRLAKVGHRASPQGEADPL